MARRGTSARTKERAELLGIRVTPALKTKIKVEAARRGVPVAQLFEEMWRHYLEKERAHPEG